MNKITAHRIYFAFIFFVFVAKYIFGKYTHNMVIEFNPTYLYTFLRQLGVAVIVTNKIAATIFHSLILLNALIGFLKPKTLVPVILNSILLIIFLTFCNTFNPYQNHPIIVITMISFVFWTKKQETFNILIKGFRYFFIYHLFSAGIFKLLNGGFLHNYQFTTILKHQHIYELTHATQAWYSQFIHLLLANPIFTELIYRVATFVELTFAIGFFTKKYDWLLFSLFIIFFLSNLLLMRISFYEMYIGLLCFTNHETVDKLKLKGLNLFSNRLYK